jgi:S1-C subfamily serine protease
MRFCIAALLSLCVVGSAGASAQELSAKQVAQGAFPSTVLLLMEDPAGQPSVLGSGFFVADNLIATNFHVIRGAAKGYAKLVGQGARFPIKGVAGVDENRDLALLAVDAKAPALRLADKEGAEIGDQVYAVGNPEGLEGTFSQGLVSGIRHVNGDTILQVTAPVSPGSSGGPVLNSKCNVVGIAVATFTEGQNLNFAVPVA